MTTLQIKGARQVLQYLIRDEFLKEMYYWIDGFNSQGVNGYRLTIDPNNIKGLFLPQYNLGDLDLATEIAYQFNSNDIDSCKKIISQESYCPEEDFEGLMAKLKEIGMIGDEEYEEAMENNSFDLFIDHENGIISTEGEKSKLLDENSSFKRQIISFIQENYDHGVYVDLRWGKITEYREERLLFVDEYFENQNNTLFDIQINSQGVLIQPELDLYKLFS